MSGWDGQQGVRPQAMRPTWPPSPVPAHEDGGGAERGPAPVLTERFTGRGSEPVFYANSAQVTRSAHDVALQFGVVLSASPSEVTTRVLASVYMSESHARALLALLQQVVP